MDIEDTQLNTFTVYFEPTEVPFENMRNETWLSY